MERTITLVKVHEGYWFGVYNEYKLIFQSHGKEVLTGVEVLLQELFGNNLDILPINTCAYYEERGVLPEHLSDVYHYSSF